MKFFTYNESEPSKHAFRLKITVSNLRKFVQTSSAAGLKGTKVNSKYFHPVTLLAYLQQGRSVGLSVLFFFVLPPRLPGQGSQQHQTHQSNDAHLRASPLLGMDGVTRERNVHTFLIVRKKNSKLHAVSGRARGVLPGRLSTRDEVVKRLCHFHRLSVKMVSHNYIL